MTLTRTPATPRARVRVVASLLAAITLVACALMYLMWWSQPTAFDARGNAITVTAQVADPQTWNLDVGESVSDEIVTLRSIEPVVVQNSADADIELVVCRWKPGLDARLGADTGSLSKYCSDTSPVPGRAFNLDSTDPQAESIIIRVTPKQRGRVEVAGVKVDYRRGWRHLWQTGTEHTGPDVAITAK